MVINSLSGFVSKLKNTFCTENAENINKNDYNKTIDYFTNYFFSYLNIDAIIKVQTCSVNNESAMITS